MRKLGRLFLLFILFTTILSGLSAEESSDSSDWKFSVAGLRVLWFGVTPTGGDATLTYSGIELMEDLNTYLFFKFGGGYEEKVYYHTADGSVLYDTYGLDKEYKRRATNFQWEAALYQGLTWNERTDDNLLEAFLYYRGRFDDYNYNAPAYDSIVPYLFDPASPFTDQEGLFGTSLMAGVCWKDLTEDSHQVQKGIYGEVSAEYGPRWLANALFGDTDYWRLNLQAKAFLPLFDLDETSEKNIFSIYLGDYLSVDYSGGESVPVYVIQTFGGKGLRKGLGGSVRGYDKYAWDTRFKAVNNLELRVNGPALGHPKLIPTLFGYFDAGYFAGYQTAPGVFTTDAGFLCSAGAGIAINAFGIEHVRLSFDFPLIGERRDRKTWFMDIDFGLHF